MNYQTAKTLVSRVINDELIVIQLDTGRYHYFNKEAGEFLEAFKEGSSFEGYLFHHQIDPQEKKHLEALCHSLLERKILQKVRSPSSHSFGGSRYHRPEFLRDGEKTLDQISFASP